MNQLEPLIQQQQLANLSSLLQQSLQGINNQSTYATFKNLQSRPESYLYFLALLISPHFQESLRELAGINLKNMLKRNIESLPKQTLDLIKRVLFQQYDAQTGKILKIIGLIMGSVVQKIKFQRQTLEFLLKKASQGNIFAIESLKRIVEDFRFDSENMTMIQTEHFAQLAKQLVKILLPQCQSQIKQYAIDCFNMLIYPMPVSLVPSLKQFVAILKHQIVNNENPNVLLVVMEGFEAIVSTRKDLIDFGILQLLAGKTFKDPKICKVEVNFWIEALDSDSEVSLQPILSQLLPKFITGLALTNQDIANMIETSSRNYAQENQEEDAEGIEGEEDQEMGKGGDYTLRKRCGLIIQKLSYTFADQLWDLSKQYISMLLNSNEWLKHQLAILYIGLISQNCGEVLKENINEIILMINKTMQAAGQHHFLKSTCLWTLSQNVQALVGLAMQQEGTLNNYIGLILNGMKDEHNNVRQASCNSLSRLIDEVNEKILPWFDSICEVITPALFAFKGNALNLLLQLYSVLAEKIRKENYNKNILDQILVPLCQKWATVPKQSDDNCQLLECLVTACEMGKQYLGEYTLQLYGKAIQLFDPKFKQIFCRAGDLLEVLIKGTTIEQQQQIVKTGIIQRTLELVTSNDHDVKQSCYTLLSHIVENIGVPNHPQVMDYILKSINMKRESEINNGMHCVLEIMLKYPDTKEYINELVSLAAERLMAIKLQTHFKVNYSKILGIVAFYHPEIVAAYLKNIFVSFCKAMKASNQHTGRYHLAISGMFKLISLKGQDIFSDFKYFADLGVCMKNVPAQNQTYFKELLKQYRQGVGDQGWNDFLGDSHFLPAAVHKLQMIANS